MNDMMQEQGLAQQMAEPQGQAPQISPEEIAELLMQGVDPEELLKRGVPIEVVKQAIQMVMQMEQQQQGVQPDSRQVMAEPGDGLARMASVGAV